MNPRRHPPALYDAALEEAVLGAMLHSPEVCRVGLERLCPEDFGASQARELFEVLAKVGEADPSRVAHHARQTGLELRPYIVTLAGEGTNNPRLVEDMLALRRRRSLEDASVLIRRAAESEEPDTALRIARMLVAPDASANGWRRTSAKELLAQEFTDPAWVIPGLLPEGMCLFAARPKTGKSWLMLQASIALATGGVFFGQTLEQRGVLYFALEDGDKRLALRLKALECPHDVEGLTFQFGMPYLGAGGAEYVTGLVEELSPAVVVVDTASKALDPKIDQDSNAQMTAALGPLQRMALERHISVVLVDHLRKSEGRHAKDVLTEVLGSTAKVGVSDTIWGLYRKERERRGELTVTGRDLEDTNLVVDFTALPGGWQLVGTAEEVRKSAAQQRYIDALRELGPATREQVAAYVGVSVQGAGEVLRRLVDLGTLQVVVQRTPAGGSAHVYDLRARARVGERLSILSDLSVWEGPWWEE